MIVGSVFVSVLIKRKRDDIGKGPSSLMTGSNQSRDETEFSDKLNFGTTTS